MEFADITRFFLALAFVIGLIWAIAAIVKKTGFDKKLRGATGGQGRLQVVDVHYIDPKRKLLLVRADANEYLILVAGDTTTLIDKVSDAKTA